jgi:hypothetical protein
MPEFDTVLSLLDVGRDAAPATGSPSQRALSYAGLRTLTKQTIDRLGTLVCMTPPLTARLHDFLTSRVYDVAHETPLDAAARATHGGRPRGWGMPM